MRTLPVGWRSFFVEGCQEGEDIGLGRDSGDTTRVREGGEKEGRQRERISARARTPSGDTTKVP